MEENKSKILPLNKYISSLLRDKETGVDLDSGIYEVSEQIINSDIWKGKNYSFRMGPVDEKRVIVGDRCYLKFSCKATTGTSTSITDATIELRDGIGDLLVDTVQLKISGYDVHNDPTAPKTSHMYNHINYPNSARSDGLFDLNFVHDEKKSFPTGADIQLIGGSANTVIKNQATFTICRDLNEVAFMGPRDTVIPGLLPVSLNIQLSNNPASCFNCASSVTASPKLHIYSIALYVYTVKITDGMSAQIGEALYNEDLIGTYDSWHTADNGRIHTGQNSHIGIPVEIETVPDFFAVVFEPIIENTDLAYKGRHLLTTTWNNVSKIAIKKGGTTVREYEIEDKTQMLKELEQLTGGNSQAGFGGISPINGITFRGGWLSFFPVVNRDISNLNVLEPNLNTITFNATMNSSKSVEGRTYLLYKIRHQLKYSLTPGRTQIIK